MLKVIISASILVLLPLQLVAERHTRPLSLDKKSNRVTPPMRVEYELEVLSEEKLPVSTIYLTRLNNSGEDDWSDLEQADTFEII